LLLVEVHRVPTPLVSAIIVNRNGAHHLRICLPSLLAQSYKALEIIVVDNASADESGEVAKEFGARWLPLDTNLGLAPALNRGTAVAGGEFLLFVNNDMRFDERFVATLIEPLMHDEDIFAADALQYNWEGTTIGHSATCVTKAPSQRMMSIELVPGLYLSQEEKTEITPAVMASAASILVRKPCFQKLGGFDERLPMGYEDVEICWRAWIHGWKTVYVPNAICWHRVGSSTRSPEGARILFRGVLKGRLVLATKLLPFRFVLRTWLIATAGVAKDLIQFRLRIAGDRIHTLIECGGYIPALLREKNALFCGHGRTAEEQLANLLQLRSEEGAEAQGRRRDAKPGTYGANPVAGH
jgi:GT2 family glycosyltransferase